MSNSLNPQAYEDLLLNLKQRIRTTQVKAALAFNRELILLYWHIGHEILERQRREKWGSKVIERLAKDLRAEFPEMKGFSLSNLKYMRLLAEAYSEEEIGQRSVGLLPWRHNIALIEKLKSQPERFWYADKALENGWSRDVLVMQIESNLHLRLGGAITNFARTLPLPQSDLARQLIKDPYILDFFTLEQEAQERDLEKALVTHIRDFLMELGMGFAFLGSQYPIEVGGKEYRLDLLFYHVKLHCYVVIDLKMREFEPAFSGQMNFYTSAVDELLRDPEDRPTIGIILCKSKEQTTVEFALRNIQSPIGVASFQMKGQMKGDVPELLKANLPTIEQLESELQAAVEEIKKSG